MNAESIAAVIFIVFLAGFLYFKRKNLETKSLVPYVIYFSMYKTTWGISLMDSMAKRFRRLTVWAGYFGILIGFLGMVLISFELFRNLFILFIKPEAASGVGLVLPVKGKGIFYVPFFYWIISIFIIAVVHEFSHGLVARAHNIKVKSSGFAFLSFLVPIIPAAFVEPDEKVLRKRPYKEQLSVFAAGPLSNIILAFVCLAIASFLIAPAVDAVMAPNGVKIVSYVEGEFPAKKAGIGIGEIVQKVDDNEIKHIENLSSALKAKSPGDHVIITTDKSSYQITLAKNPENETLAYIGAYLEQDIKIKDNVKKKLGTFIPNAVVWVYGLFSILIILNLGIGLFNLVPLGPVDGGRMMQLACHKFFDKTKGNMIWGYISLIFLLIIFMNIAAGFGLFNFLK